MGNVEGVYCEQLWAPKAAANVSLCEEQLFDVTHVISWHTVLVQLHSCFGPDDNSTMRCGYS